MDRVKEEKRDAAITRFRTLSEREATEVLYGILFAQQVTNTLIKARKIRTEAEEAARIKAMAIATIRIIGEVFGSERGTLMFYNALAAAEGATAALGFLSRQEHALTCDETNIRAGMMYGIAAALAFTGEGPGSSPELDEIAMDCSAALKPTADETWVLSLGIRRESVTGPAATQKSCAAESNPNLN